MKFIMKLFIPAFLGFCALLGSCSSDSIERRLDVIDSMLSSGDVEGARKQCAGVIDDSKMLDAMTTSQLVRLAVDYALLADASEQQVSQDDLATASMLYEKAIALSADSVEMLINKLEDDRTAAGNLLFQIFESSMAQSDSLVIADYEENDSVF